MLKSRIFWARSTTKVRSIPACTHQFSTALWDRVQTQLATNLQGTRTSYQRRQDLLAGKIVDASDKPLVSTHSCKDGANGKVRYRYYVSRDLHHGDAETGMRIPAREIETLVTDRLAQTFDDPLALAANAWLI